MFEHMDDAKLVSSFRQRSKHHGKSEGRATHGFLFRIKGYADFRFEDRDLHLSEGEFIFLPKGTAYEYTTNSEGENLYTSVNFLGTVEHPEVRVYPMSIFVGSDFLCQRFSENLTFGTAADRLGCMALFYDLLFHIQAYEQQNDKDRRKFEVLEPAMEYLRQHIFDTELRIRRLPRLCGISDTYFRALFVSRFRTVPREYVTTRRLERAKVILESGDFESIKEVALSVGYTDPLYFSKEFKRMFGLSPSELNR